MHRFTDIALLLGFIAAGPISIVQNSSAQEPLRPRVVRPAAQATEPATFVADTPQPTASTENYMLQLDQYRFTDGATASLSATELLGKLLSPDSGAVLVQTMRLSVLGGEKCTVQFGKSVGVVRGTVTRGPTVQKQMSDVQVGSMIRVIVTQVNDLAKVDLSYETSQLIEKPRENEEVESQETAESGDNIATMNVETVKLVEIGKSYLVAGTSADKSSYLVLTLGK
jgi:hypothetical protein